MLALAAADLGQRDEALHAAEKAAQSTESRPCNSLCSPSVLATAASALARAGQRDRAKQVLEHALALAKTRYVCRFLLRVHIVTSETHKEHLTLSSWHSVSGPLEYLGSGWIPE